MAPRLKATASIQNWAAIRSFLLSMISANAPAGRARRNIGRVPAVWTSETIKGEGAREVMSQPAPTSWIQVPILEKIVAIHKERKAAIFSGLQADRGCKFSFACGSFGEMDIGSSKQFFRGKTNFQSLSVVRM